MITEDYVSFEVAKLLKEKGFDEQCTYMYNSQHKLYSTFEQCRQVTRNNSDWIRYIGPLNVVPIAVPTLQMAMKWLRETHDIDFDINTTGSRHVRRYHLAIWENKDEEMVTINPIGYFNKWEQACEEAIKYCLENLI